MQCEAVQPTDENSPVEAGSRLRTAYDDFARRWGIFHGLYIFLPDCG